MPRLGMRCGLVWLTLAALSAASAGREDVGQGDAGQGGVDPGGARSLEDNPSERLQAAGLFPSGRWWICEAESELQRHLAQLSRRERTFFTRRDSFRQLVGQYESYRKELTELRERLDRIRGRLEQSTLTASSRQQLQSESSETVRRIKRVQGKVDEELGTLEERSPMTDATVELIAAQGELACSLLEVNRLQSAMRDHYRQAAGDPQIRRDLAALAPRGILGPTEGSLPGGLDRRLARLRAATMTDGVPYYRRSRHYRVGVILAERTPATLSYTGATGPTLLPWNLIKAAGLQVNRGLPLRTVEIGDREIRVRPVRVPSLRIGQHVFQQVEAAVLPPEAEDLGGRFSMEALGDRQVELDEGRLRFRLLGQGATGE